MASQPIRGSSATASTAASAAATGCPVQAKRRREQAAGERRGDGTGERGWERERLGALERVAGDGAAVVGDLGQRVLELGGELVERPALLGLGRSARSMAAISGGGRSLRERLSEGSTVPTRRAVAAGEPARTGLAPASAS